MSTSNPVSSLIQPLGEMPPEAVVFGTTDAMRSLRERLAKIAGANVPVLIQGESGTGKDIIARMIHANSPWKTGPWVKVNCPAIPGTLLESELFGYEKGAFTGAFGTKPGRVEMAHRGTLFLDEISSRNSVPRCAISTRPGLVPKAPVKAPFSYPKSSLSSRVPGIAGQFTFTQGPVFHGEFAWIIRAIMSLPVPLSP